MRRLFFLICILCFSACSEKESPDKTIIVDKLPEVKGIVSEVLEVPPILLKPRAVCIVDTFLIIAQGLPDSIFSIFTLPDCKYLMSFGTRGRGPNEFIDYYSSFTLAPVYNNQSTFAVGNKTTNIQYYRISDVLQKSITPYKIEELPREIDGFATVGYFDDSVFICAPFRLNMLLAKYNSNNKNLSRFRSYPNVYSFEDLNDLRNLYSGALTVKKDKSKFAKSYGNQGIIEIYNINDSVPVTISYKGFPSLEENNGLNNDSKRSIFSKDEMIFCWGICSTNRYIYAKIYNDHYYNISDGKGLIRSYIAEIHVFDWSGKLVARIKPDYFYSHFAVDMNDKYLYALDDNREDIIRRYDLQKALPE